STASRAAKLHAHTAHSGLSSCRMQSFPHGRTKTQSLVVDDPGPRSHEPLAPYSTKHLGHAGHSPYQRHDVRQRSSTEQTHSLYPRPNNHSRSRRFGSYGV